MTKKVTIQAVAEVAEVSSAAVSLFLNNKPGLAEATRDRIRATIDALGYIPRKTSAKQSERALISLSVEKLPFSMFSELHYGVVLHSMQAEAQNFGYDLVLNVFEGARNYALNMPQNVDGVLVLGGGDITARVVDDLLQSVGPVLLVDVHFPLIQATSVLADNFGGAQVITKHLIECGYERIACIQGPNKYPSLVERFQGYCVALIEAGMSVDPRLVQPPISEGFPNKGYREMKALLAQKRPFDAVFCVSDRAALGALQALQEASIRVPEEMGIAGFEDVPQAAFSSPPLTTVKMPKAAMGKAAIRQIVRMIRGGSLDEVVKIVLPTELVKRNSTAAPPS